LAVGFPTVLVGRFHQSYTKRIPTTWVRFPQRFMLVMLLHKIPLSVQQGVSEKPQDLLFLFHYFKAVDLRDKVYAVLIAWNKIARVHSGEKYQGTREDLLDMH
jgi:hypothetical protein